MWQDPAWTIHPSLHQLDEPWAKEHVVTCLECIRFAAHVSGCHLCLTQLEDKLATGRGAIEFTYS